MLKPTSSSLSVIGLRPTYLSLSPLSSLLSIYTHTLACRGHIEPSSFVLRLFFFPVIFSLQYGIRARNLLGFLRLRRLWHLLQRRRHLLQRRRHRFLAYASSSSRLRRYHVVIASSSRFSSPSWSSALCDCFVPVVIVAVASR